MEDLRSVGLVGGGVGLNFHPNSAVMELNHIQKALCGESGRVGIVYGTGFKGALDIRPLTIV